MSETLHPAPSAPCWARAVWMATPERVLAAGAGLVLLASYALVFFVTRDANPAGAILRALINVVPASLLAVPAYRAVEARVVSAPLGVQALAHPALALGYALAWYLGIQVLYGLQDGWMARGLVPRSFSGIALTWQMFQGVTVYAVIASYAYAAAYWRRAKRLEEELAAARAQLGALPARAPSPARLLLRQDREIVPIDPGDIVRISGAGDRTEVVTRTGRVTTTTTMAELEGALPDGFLRVHRSHLVALSAVLHAEPAGNGRLTLHLPGGDSVTASRAGAKAFREAAL